MSPQSLLIILTHPPQVRLQDALLEDYVSSEIDGTPMFASVPPWNPMHDLLVDRETQTLAGIVYPVAAGEQAAIAAICQSLPTQVVRYCISPVSAAALLRDFETPLSNSLRQTGDPNVSVMQFPQSLRPHRQLLRGVLAGEIEHEQLPEELRPPVAAKYFEDNAAAAHLGEWASGGGSVARVEVTWVNKPVNTKLPSYFPSDFDIELAQYFAEDIWFYREDDQRIYAIGVNYLDQTLDDYGLQLPTGFLKDAA
ncbi:MAG TPA: hypothetical protein VFH31_02770 [Pyrinomonadaceae bacterium]|nr:hypothetical protein [Pyrinomonadaceae bacterium]